MAGVPRKSVFWPFFPFPGSKINCEHCHGLINRLPL
jgi:hypothetical protein